MSVPEYRDVWVRDKFHNHYLKWSKAIFIGYKKNDLLDKNGIIVSYYVKLNGKMVPQYEEDRTIGGVCGWFPEWTFDEPAKEEQEERVYT